jgi:hypothetical protein
MEALMGRNSGGGGKGQAVIPTQKPKNPQSEEYRAYAYKIMLPDAGLRVRALGVSETRLLEKGYRYVVTPDAKGNRAYQTQGGKANAATKMYAANTDELTFLAWRDVDQRLASLRGDAAGFEAGGPFPGSGTFADRTAAAVALNNDIYRLEGVRNYWSAQYEASVARRM